ncbi:hypothetical protein ABGB16_11240 [Micromonospora sp. B11E3]
MEIKATTQRRPFRGTGGRVPDKCVDSAAESTSERRHLPVFDAPGK